MPAVVRIAINDAIIMTTLTKPSTVLRARRSGETILRATPIPRIARARATTVMAVWLIPSIAR